jgi:hypothetical protein
VPRTCSAACLFACTPHTTLPHRVVVLLQSLFTAPLAVLAEGGLAHALRCLLTREPLDSMAATEHARAAHEASLRLLGAAMVKDPLKPLLLMPAGAPTCLQVRAAASCWQACTSGAMTRLRALCCCIARGADCPVELMTFGA